MGASASKTTTSTPSIKSFYKKIGLSTSSLSSNSSELSKKSNSSKKSKKNISKISIGSPTDFVHLSHTGSDFSTYDSIIDLRKVSPGLSNISLETEQFKDYSKALQYTSDMFTLPTENIVSGTAKKVQIKNVVRKPVVMISAEELNFIKDSQGHHVGINFDSRFSINFQSNKMQTATC